jgi:hypothetical protein
MEEIQVEGQVFRFALLLSARVRQRFNRHHRRDGSLFRGPYKAILIDANEEIWGQSAFVFVPRGNSSVTSFDASLAPPCLHHSPSRFLLYNPHSQQ